MIHLVLLSGGSGTRLWPLSNEARSKQFLKVLRDEAGNHVSMVQRVFSQIENIAGNIDITIATCEAQRSSIERQVEGNYALVLEPERRDTAAAIMLACAHLGMEQCASESDTVVVMPIDSYASQSYYDKILDLDDAVQSDLADLILLGVRPSCPTSKYGYIVPASNEGQVWPVERFVEKPSEITAKELINCGALWNCGVFAFRLGYLENVTRNYTSAASFECMFQRYGDLPKVSFDYEVVEKARSIAVVPYSGDWRDLGTWNTLCEEMAESYSGRVAVDEASCRNVHVVNETGLPMVVAGISDSVVVATPDGILVSGKDASASIKAQVEKAAESRPMYERRQWGEYRVLDMSVYPDGALALSKELVIENGRQISYQRHRHRSEVWTVVSGTGEVVLDGETVKVEPGSVISIKPMQMHSVRSTGELHIIEVQLGEALEESDIERFGNYWK